MNLSINKNKSQKFICYYNWLILILLITSPILNSYSTFAQVEPELLDGTSKAPVMLDGKTLFIVIGTTSYPAEERAKVIKERIEDIAGNFSLRVDSIRVIHSENQDDLFISNKFILTVIDADARLEGVRREAFVLIIKRAIIESIRTYRNDRNSEVLLNKTFYAIGATLITLLLLLLLHWITKKVRTRLEILLKSKIETLESRSFQMIRSKQLWITFYSFINTIKILLILIIIFIYAQYVLGLYPWTRAVSISLLGFFLKPLSAFGTSLLDFIPDLAFLIIIYFITRYLLKLIKLLFYGLEHETIKISGFDPEWSIPTYKILRILLVAFAIIVAYPYIPGSDSDAFKGVSLFIGILFSLGSSSLIGNLMAGYSMTYRKTFKRGDLVRIENHLGEVMDMKLFVTRLKTPKNEEIIVPNSTILNNNVVNYSSLARERGLILYTTVGIGYETPWRQVEEMLKEAAERTEGISKDPPPFVLQKLLGDFAVTYELNVYCKDPNSMMKHYTALHQNILDVFNENNIQIMTPAYEGDPHEPKVVPKDKWFMPLAIKSKSGGDKT
jgi:small-conductance mechanosensitive channel